VRSRPRAFTQAALSTLGLVAAVLIPGPAHADVGYLTEEQEDAAHASIMEQGVDHLTATALVAKLDGGTFLDSQLGNVDPVSRTTVNERGVTTSVQTFPDGSRLTAYSENPTATVNSGIGQMSISGCTRVVTGGATDRYVGCTIGGSDGTTQLSYEADHWTPSKTVQGPYPFAKITSVYTWGGSTPFGSISKTSFGVIRSTATSTLPALARLAVQSNTPFGTYPLRLDFKVSGNGSSRSTSTYSP